MSNEEKSLLGSLLAQNVKRSKIGKIRERFSEIEEAQRQGVRNIDIVNALNADGHELTLKTFENMLHRIRKDNSDRKSTSPAVVEKNKVASIQPKKENADVIQHHDNDTISAYKKVCFGSERIAQRAIEAGISIDEIKSWKCPNQVNLGTRLSNHIQNK